ncbi:hypothetical protein O181_080182 [Austropuccinia psidii MF-1]|uniref:Integrase catalytic domain-containing protein n=1 Tax=Austropuccinia psidii MF-1 TaxID=1389203 RepID=A0A9Q3FNF6_9BASI|nr:hypothetical protein [Austropuccinia psidii MF-1]
MSLSVASAKRHPVIGKGTINLGCRYGNIRLTEALHCPDIPGTVISLGKFMKNDGDVFFEEGIFKLKQRGCIFHSVPKSDRWYLPLNDVVSCNEISEFDKNLSQLLHRRLAHISLRTVRPKSQHSPLKMPSRLIVQDPGDVIVADLMGPFPISFDKKSYALIIQDHHSSLATLYPLRQKSEAAQTIIEWINKFNNLTDFKVKRIRTDNGGEFTSKMFVEALKARGIIHEKTMPYEHHQAGKIERTNRTIAEAARSMLIDSGLQVEMWPYAFRHAMWVFNRVLHADNTKTPYEMVTNKKPDLSPLRTFGCKAYVHNMTHRKDLTPKAKELFFLGIAEDSKGWIFWDDKQRSVIRSASAVFDERSRLTEASQTPGACAIEITHLLDPSMIQEVEAQDRSLEIMTLTAVLDGDSPRTYHEAMKTEDANKWKEAMEEELEAMSKMEVWEEVSGHQHQHVLGTRWVFATKRNQENEVTRHKARIVVQGHRQIRGLEFEETFAPTPTFTSLRCLFAVASALQWEVGTFDVTTAYLHSNIEESIYIKPPPGLQLKPGKVLALRKALYGLKQSGRCWWQHLQRVLSSIGFNPNHEDQSTYVYEKGKGKALLWIHVDDGVLAASSTGLMEQLKGELQNQLLLKWDVGIHSIVGITVRETGNAFYLSQPKLITKVCDSHPGNITTEQPLPEMNLESGPANILDKEYLSRIGMLLYLAQATRPDIMFSVNYLARFSMNTSTKHWTALNHLIDYVRGTQEKALTISSEIGNDKLQMYVDANWGGEASRSQHGYIGFLWGSPVAWNSRRQTCVASSTCQAEYMALSFAARAGMWISQAIGIAMPGLIPTLLSDNRAAIRIAENSGSRKNSRHIQREFHLVNELIIKNQVTITWVDSKNQKADIFTKRLGKLKVKKFNDDIFGE